MKGTGDLMHNHNWKDDYGIHKRKVCLACRAVMNDDNAHESCDMMETAVRGVVPVRVRLDPGMAGKPIQKIQIIKSIRATTPEALDNSLTTTKAMAERLIEWNTVTVYSKNPGEFKKEVGEYGVVVVDANPPELSPQAEKVLEALASKPELWEEIQEYLRWKQAWEG